MMSCVRKFDSESFIFTWKVKNFLFCVQEKGYCISSPKFIADQTEWHLRLYPHGYMEADGYISCNLKMVSKQKVKVAFTISIVCADGLEHFSVEKVDQQFPNDPFCGADAFLSRQVIFKHKDFYLPNDTLTVRCAIRKRATETPLIKHYLVRSQITVKRLSVPWDIKDFGSLQLKQILAYPFTFKLEKYPSFEIQFCLVGESLESSQIQINIRKDGLPKPPLVYQTPALIVYDRLKEAHENEEVSVVMSSDISILDRKGIPFFLKNQSHFFGQSKYEDVWSLSEIMKTNDLLTKRNLLLPEDVLSLRFEFVASVGDMESLPAEVRAAYPENRCVNPSSTMRDDFYHLYKEQAFSDITLTTGSMHFKAHRAILSCRSPVFRAMFEHDMMENATGAVNIPDVNSETLGRMLVFLYADKLEEALDLKSLVDLYRAADKYQISTLKEQCYPSLRYLISVENVCEVLSVAYQYQDEAMKTIAEAFICKHPKETMDSGVWKELMEKKMVETNCEKGEFPLQVTTSKNRAASEIESESESADGNGYESPCKNIKLI